MREYETAFIVQPEISDEGSLAIRGKLDSVLENEGAARLMCEDLGKRKLAYEVRRFQKGHYYILSFLDEGGAIPELERMLRLEESVLRFMTVQISDHIGDTEARIAEAREAELAQEKRAEERAARDAEDARLRAEAEAENAAARAREESERAALEQQVEADEKQDEAVADPEGDDEAADPVEAVESEETSKEEPSA